MLTIQRLPQPVIAQVHGIATAGGLPARRGVRSRGRGRRCALRDVRHQLRPVLRDARRAGVAQRRAEARVRDAVDRRVHRRGDRARVGPRQPRRARRGARRRDAGAGGDDPRRSRATSSRRQGVLLPPARGAARRRRTRRRASTSPATCWAKRRRRASARSSPSVRRAGSDEARRHASRPEARTTACPRVMRGRCGGAAREPCRCRARGRHRRRRSVLREGRRAHRQWFAANARPSGQTTPEGVRLLRADSNEAEFEVAGKRQVLGLGRGRFGGAGAAENPSVTLYADGRGHFVSDGTINGVVSSLPGRYRVRRPWR